MIIYNDDNNDNNNNNNFKLISILFKTFLIYSFISPL